jgi:hypothetical protein
MAEAISLYGLPEVEEVGGEIMAERAGVRWWFDKSDPITMDDVKAVAAVALWFERHPEVVPGGDD